MRDVKKTLEMRDKGYSQRQIAKSLRISRETLRKIFSACDAKQISWSSVQNLNEQDIQNLLFEIEPSLNLGIKQRDLDHVHKELMLE